MYMHCPKCQSDDVEIVDYDESGGTIYSEKLLCNSCGQTFSTDVMDNIIKVR